MAGVHEDFGEKIGGAKKDLWKDRGLYADDLEAMNEREAEKFVKKDNVWKKPDYAAMLEEGIPLGVVYFIKKARDGLNASPQYYRTDDTPEKRTARQKEYIKTVRELQTVLSDVRTVEDAVRAYDRFFVDNGYLEKVQGWGSGIHYRATKKGQDNPVITNKLSNTMLIRSAEYFERNFTQEAKKEQFCVSKEQKIPKGYAIHFNDGKQTYSKNGDWKPGTYYVTKGYSILRTNFGTKEAALKWVQELAKGRNKNGKIRFVPPQLAHVKRTGPDYRNGVEITGQHYLDTFGFRGGEFGNWMNQNDRQTSLNMGFEALKDLASALKISDGDHLTPGSELKIEHSVVCENVDISTLITMGTDSLEAMRQGSIDGEQKAYEIVVAAAKQWEQQAAATQTINRALEYLRTPEIEHTGNQWKDTDNWRADQKISNRVYQMTCSIWEDTKYDRETKQSVPVAWYVTWEVRIHSPKQGYGAKIAGQNQKRYTDKNAAIKYLDGRKKAYSHLFTEISPPIPKEYEHHFMVHGTLLPAYTVEGLEQAKTEHAAAEVSEGGIFTPENREKPSVLGKLSVAKTQEKTPTAPGTAMKKKEDTSPQKGRFCTYAEAFVTKL